MTTSNNSRWRIIQISGWADLLIGLFYLAMPPASSSALVEALHRAPAEEHFDIAHRYLCGVFWFTGLVQILFGVIAVFISTKAIQTRDKEK